MGKGLKEAKENSQEVFVAIQWRGDVGLDNGARKQEESVRFWKHFKDRTDQTFQ